MSTKMNRLYLDIHALQVLPPSCVNRDDTNTPKSCFYGGTERSRVSSQCWKRAARLRMTNIGIRTTQFHKLVCDELVKNYGFSEDEASTTAAWAIKAAKIVSDKNGAKDTIAFFSNDEIKNFAKVIADNKEIAVLQSKESSKKSSKKSSKEESNEEASNEESTKDEQEEKSELQEVKDLKKALVEAVKTDPSSDILLFGRMFASNKDLNVDASCQVAHAISVNETRMEYDYFTAVDDVPRDKNGSAFLETKSFTDPVLYRYANVNLSDTSSLIVNQKKDAAKIAREFTEAFLLSMPTGSMNGYANATLPEHIVLTLRMDMPVSFAPAFINATSSNDFVAEAKGKMDDYVKKISTRYGKPKITLSLEDYSLEAMLSKLEEEIENILNKEI